MDARLFSYVFAHLVQSKNTVFVEYMLNKLELFRDQIDCNQLLAALEMKSYQIQIDCCRYLKRKNYYLDALTVSRILKYNCDSYYDGVVRRNRLLRELYDFDTVVFELVLPLHISCYHVNLITP